MCNTFELCNSSIFFVQSNFIFFLIFLFLWIDRYDIESWNGKHVHVSLFWKSESEFESLYRYIGLFHSFHSSETETDWLTLTLRIDRSSGHQIETNKLTNKQTNKRTRVNFTYLTHISCKAIITIFTRRTELLYTSQFIS